MGGRGQKSPGGNASGMRLIDYWRQQWDQASAIMEKRYPVDTNKLTETERETLANALWDARGGNEIGGNNTPLDLNAAARGESLTLGLNGVSIADLRKARPLLVKAATDAETKKALREDIKTLIQFKKDQGEDEEIPF